MRRLITRSPAQTAAFGRAIGRALRSPAVIALEGNLGAGKTVLVKGLARGLGVKHIIQSPTFVLMRVYPVGRPGIDWLAHVDCYRLQSAQDLVDIGLPEYIHGKKAVVVIEWADKASALLPQRVMRVRLQRRGVSERNITISGGHATIIRSRAGKRRTVPRRRSEDR